MLVLCVLMQPAARCVTLDGQMAATGLQLFHSLLRCVALVMAVVAYAQLRSWPCGYPCCHPAETVLGVHSLMGECCGPYKHSPRCAPLLAKRALHAHHRAVVVVATVAVRTRGAATRRFMGGLLCYAAGADRLGSRVCWLCVVQQWCSMGLLGGMLTRHGVCSCLVWCSAENMPAPCSAAKALLAPQHCTAPPFGDGSNTVCYSISFFGRARGEWGRLVHWQPNNGA
jgi:hypothetical protein